MYCASTASGQLRSFFGTNAIAYGAQQERIGKTTLYVAPSTSGAANGFWDPCYWQEVANRVKAGTSATP